AGAYFTVANAAPGCFFLEQGGLCGIHREYGYSAKPETCRLFPFNDFRRFGSYLAVMPHSGLCPLCLAQGDAAAPLSDHGLLFRQMGLSSFKVPVATVDHQGLRPDQIVSVERAIVEL